MTANHRKSRREQLWCNIHPHGFDALNTRDTLTEVGRDGRYVGTYVVTSSWQARVSGGWMLAIAATLPGDDRVRRGGFTPDGDGSRVADGTVLIRPAATK